MLSLLLPLLSAPALAEVHNFALLVANNQGGPGTEPLYFADDDARKVHSVLTGLAGYAEEDVLSVIGGERRDFLQSFGDLKLAMEQAADEGDEVVLFFFYSGHADEQGLMLRNTRVSYEELEALLDRSGADVRMAFIDACQSGGATRRKGGTRQPGFVHDVSERLGAEGTVIITSSASDEASQESDEIAGSYFTHYLVSGMAGFADENGDARVSLGEAYDYIFYETVVRTSQSALGAQHPTYEWDLSGQGDVVLVDLTPTSSALLFSADMQGNFAIFDVERRSFLGEVALDGRDRRMAVQPGRYLVQVRYPTHLQVAEVRVKEGQVVDLSQATFEPVSYDKDQAKGAVELEIRRERGPDNAVLLHVGSHYLANDALRGELFPPTGSVGVSYRMTRKGTARSWWGLDVSGGSALRSVTPVADMPVQVRASYSTAGLSVGWASRELFPWPGYLGGFGRRIGYQAGVGARFGGLYLDRSFPDGQLEPQSALAPAGGWTGYLQTSLVPRKEHGMSLLLDLSRTSSVVGYAVSADQNAFATRQWNLALGLRF
ncbi:MAG: caspase family protein [Myxococcota bacterium]|nr:caspase family protein [Myxococcota bacterium]